MLRRTDKSLRFRYNFPFVQLRLNACRGATRKSRNSLPVL